MLNIEGNLKGGVSGWKEVKTCYDSPIPVSRISLLWVLGNLGESLEKRIPPFLFAREFSCFFPLFFGL